MSDLDLARASLPGHTIAVCLDGSVVTDDGRGVAPMMKMIREGVPLRGASVADRVVGKAAAALFVLAGVAAVWAETVSSPALDYLGAHGIPAGYAVLTDRIVNRAGDGLCPMESAVMGIDDPAEAYRAIEKKIEELKNLNSEERFSPRLIDNGSSSVI